jgi:hypothetical protein
MIDDSNHDSNHDSYPSAPAVPISIVDPTDDDHDHDHKVVYASANLLLANNMYNADDGVAVTGAISIPVDPWNKPVVTPRRRTGNGHETPTTPLSTIPVVEDAQEKKARRRMQRRVKMTGSFMTGTFFGGLFLGPIGFAAGGVTCAAISRTASKCGEKMKDRRLKVLLAQYNGGVSTENDNGNQNEMVG